LKNTKKTKKTKSYQSPTLELKSFLFFPFSLFFPISSVLFSKSQQASQESVARRPRLLAPLRLLGEKFNTGFALAQPRLNFSLVGSANASLVGSAPPAGSASLRLLARTPRTTITHYY